MEPVLLAAEEKKRKNELVATLDTSLMDALPVTTSFNSNPLPVGKVTTRKSRRQLMATEAAQFSAVLGHASFQQNPLLTIAEHIRNTTALQVQQRQSDQQALAASQAKAAKKKNQRQQLTKSRPLNRSQVLARDAAVANRQRTILRAKRRNPTPNPAVTSTVKPTVPAKTENKINPNSSNTNTSVSASTPTPAPAPAAFVLPMVFNSTSQSGVQNQSAVSSTTATTSEAVDMDSTADTQGQTAQESGGWTTHQRKRRNKKTKENKSKNEGDATME